MGTGTAQEGRQATPRTILAVDPGDTTGWAFFRRRREGWSLIDLGDTAQEPIPRECIDFAAAIAVEPIPNDKGTPVQHRIHQFMLDHATEQGIPLYSVAPSNWKPWSRVRSRKEGRNHRIRKKSQHAKDAFWLGRYAIWRYL